jgi:hypothetical protein
MSKFKGRKWTAAQKAKAVATRAANAALKKAPEGSLEGRIKDALVYLREASGAETTEYMRALITLAAFTLKGQK